MEARTILMCEGNEHVADSLDSESTVRATPPPTRSAASPADDRAKSLVTLSIVSRSLPFRSGSLSLVAPSFPAEAGQELVRVLVATALALHRWMSGLIATVRTSQREALITQ